MNKKWESLAAKELKAKDVKETLVRETNELLNVKPLYTNEDWQPPAGEPELPGIVIITEIYLILICIYRCLSIQERSICHHVYI